MTELDACGTSREREEAPPTVRPLQKTGVPQRSARCLGAEKLYGGRVSRNHLHMNSRKMVAERLARFVSVTMIGAVLVLANGCKGGGPGGTAAAPAPSTGAIASTPEARKALKQPFTTPPVVKKNLYPPIEEAAPDIADAEKQARAEGKRVLLDFGGDWCGDCQVLDIYFHQEPNATLLNKNFVKVNVNIGHEDANVDLAHKYGVPLQGVPALAVLSPDGKVLTSQNKEFSDMRYMEPGSVTEFLNHWKP